MVNSASNYSSTMSEHTTISVNGLESTIYKLADKEARLLLVERKEKKEKIMTILAGKEDSALEQAKNLVGQYDCVFISPLKRAKETLKWSRIECENVIETDILREVRRDPCDFLENEIQIMETIDEVIERAKKANEFIDTKSVSYDKIVTS